MIDIEIQSITAADGQVINVAGEEVKRTGVNSIAFGLAEQGISKGAEAYVRVGSGFTVRTIGKHTIELGNRRIR